MAEHELSILVRAKGALQAARDIGKVDSAVGRLGRTGGKAVRNTGRNLAVIGAAAAAGVGVAVHQGIESLAELEDATTSVTGAIAQMGQTGQVTGTQVATWANEIERNVQAAFDDKDITQATATLIRFGKVTPSNLRPAMQVMTDLAVKTGSVDSAAALLAKALADPTKAAGKLARSGVILTKEQQKQIKALVKTGDVAGAQAVILRSLEKTTEGAAAASKGPYRDALNVLADVTEDAQRALGEGFLPVLMKVSDLLSGELAKPETITNIREFGKGLAGGLDSAINIAKNLPWSAIGDAFKIAGAGAKAVLGVFSSMPPWIQTAVLTGWGLNKITGGLLGDIAGGLVKGVLGMSAGVVNIKAGVVNGGGGVGSGGGGGMGAAGKALAIGSIVADVAGVVATQQIVSGQSSAHASSVHDTARVYLASNPTTDALRSSLAAVDTGIRDLKSNPLNMLVQGSALDELQTMRDEISHTLTATQKDADATISKGDAVKGQVSQSGNANVTATYGAASIISAAVNAIPAPVINIQATTISKTTTVQNRYGPPGGSRDTRHEGYQSGI